MQCVEKTLLHDMTSNPQARHPPGQNGDAHCNPPQRLIVISLILTILTGTSAPHPLLTTCQHSHTHPWGCPPSPCRIPWLLPSDSGIHFLLQLLETCILYNLSLNKPLVTRLGWPACLFCLSLPSTYRCKVSVTRPFPGSVCTTTSIVPSLANSFSAPCVSLL